jgi:hypothetical protein
MNNNTPEKGMDSFAFYTSDWQIGTLNMNRTQRSCYFDLMLLQFSRGTFTQEEAIDVLGDDAIQWEVIKKKFKCLDETNYYNERLAEEIAVRNSFIRSRTIGAKIKSEQDAHKIIINNEKYVPIAESIRNKIIETGSEAKISDEQVKDWTNDIRLMVDRDGKTVHQIEKKIEEVFNDGFWKKVIRSAGALRQRWNEGKLDRLSSGRGNSRTGGAGAATERERARGHYTESAQLRLL